jgi:transcriptional regulator with XRE-family HTH domain
MNRAELVKNKGYWISKIQVDLYNQLIKFMDENSLNQTQLASRLGVSKGYISQVLNGDFNQRISTFVDLCLAINKAPEIKFLDINEIINEFNDGIRSETWTIKIQSTNAPSNLPDHSKTIETRTIINQSSASIELKDLNIA